VKLFKGVADASDITTVALVTVTGWETRYSMESCSKFDRYVY